MEKLVKQILTRYPGPKLSWSKDWAIKVASLLFAVFLWYFVTGEDRVDMTIQVPVEIVNLPRELVISNQFKSQLEVTVSGPRGMIRRFSRQEVSRTIDLSDASPGNVVVKNEPDSVSFPHGIRVLRIQPSQIILLLDRLIHLEIPIEYAAKGSPAKNHELVSIRLEPSNLILSGPEAVLGKTDVITTNPITLTGMKDSTIKQVSLNLTPEIAELIGEPIITAHVELREKVVAQELWKIPVTINGLLPHQSATISPSKIKLRARIPLSMLDAQEPPKNFFQATINTEGRDEGVYELPIEAIAPPKAFIDNMAPGTVKINIHKKK